MVMYIESSCKVKEFFCEYEDLKLEDISFIYLYTNKYIELE